MHLLGSLMTLCSADWSSLGDFEVTTPLADLLQDISAQGIPTSEDQVKMTCTLSRAWLTLIAGLMPTVAVTLPSICPRTA